MATLTDIDLLLRGEVTTPLSTTLHDARLTILEDAINALNAQVNALSTISKTYGEMYKNGSAATTNCAVPGTYYAITGFTAGHLDLVTMGSDALIAPTAGDYQAFAMISFTGVTAHINAFTFGVAGSAVSEHVVERKLGTGSDIGAVALTGILALTAGQSVGIMVADVGSTGVVSSPYLTMVLRKIHS
jgi:hypothetical protein